MKENFSYPLNPEWSTQEIVTVMAMWEILEQTYTKRVTAEDFLGVYKNFKDIVKSIGEERQLGNEFEELTGYSLYRTVKSARAQKTGVLRIKERG
ncbi:UPF0223 family protein [Vagococcus vulneris]|uniref:Uncharacterized protein n=1 Tax=Vagococcus vulneris TaxID=1977869 RepID=A0A430A2M3_9ENTE|nr:UPF0223 family protein [Vagococcus vulneris]RSU00696.1 hypothetical protein CBF37_01405 [Vagococcus vulneris]